MNITRLAAVALACLIAVPAFAEPPPKGWYGSLPYPQVACRTKELATSVYQAGREGGDAAFVKAVVSSRGGCFLVNPTPLVFGDSEYLGEMTFDSGNVEKIWVSHVGTANWFGWLLYEESAPESPGIDT